VTTLYASAVPSCLDPLLLASLNLRGSRPNILVNCAESDVHRVARELVRWCGPRVLMCSMPGWLDVPTQGETLLLTRIEEMSLDQQIALHDWMTASHLPIHVVSVATTRLDRLVRSGRFLESLFYRLNIVQLDARSEGAAAPGRIPGTVGSLVYAI
jgi:transcriptional regulator of acetoin/glycerol metabolism